MLEDYQRISETLQVILQAIWELSESFWGVIESYGSFIGFQACYGGSEGASEWVSGVLETLQ